MKNVFLTVFLISLSMLFLAACNTTNTTASATNAAASTPKSALSETDLTIHASAKEIQPLQIGDPMPAFKVQSIDGELVDFTSGERDKPLMIVTFRGGWCPYCNLQLNSLRDVVPELTESGMDVYFLSGDRSDVLYSGLNDKAESAASNSQYKIYSDANTEAASALGIAFKLPERQRARLIDSPSVDAADGSIDKHGVLAVPSVFIIGETGDVEFVHADPNYKVRIDESDLLDAAKRVLGTN